MKKKISVSMEDRTIDEVEDRIKDGLFRNKSHLIEYATKRFLKGR